MEGVIGYTTLFAGNFAPKDWAFCQGQLMPISQNTALFSLVGNYYGGDGKTTFALPNLIGRAIVGAGQFPGFTMYSPGEEAGNTTISLTVENTPAHTHPVQTTAAPKAASTANIGSPKNAVFADANENIYSSGSDSNMQTYKAQITMQPAGNSQPLSYLHPVLAMNYIICLRGVFPARG